MKIRILSALFAVLLVASLVSMTSCSKQQFESTVNVTFRVPKGEYAKMSANEITAALKDGAEEKDVYENLFGPYEITILATEDDPATVLQAATESLEKFEIDKDISADGTYISSVTFDGVQYQEEDHADSSTGYFSYWDCTVNGERSSSGRQSVTLIYDEDDIIYTWTSSSQPRQDTGAVVTTDPNAETTSEIPTDETTILADTDEVA